MIGYKGWQIPEGNVVQVTDASGVVLWAVQSDKPIILEVEKITSNTYAGETTYTSEEFILLDIYPKTNGTVKVTYGGLTKTIVDTSGAEEPNAQQVFFGTFNGVSDSVTTPVSGTLTIEGDCVAFGCSTYNKSSKDVTKPVCGCVTAITDFGSVNHIPDGAFYGCKSITKAIIPASVKAIGKANAIMGRGAFYDCESLTEVVIPEGVVTIGDYSFYECNSLPNIIIPSSVTEIGNSGFYYCDNLKSVTMLPTTPPTLGTETVFKTSYDSIIVTITVPKGCGEAYKTAELWSVYADYIVEES